MFLALHPLPLCFSTSQTSQTPHSSPMPIAFTYNPDHAVHQKPGHVERPERLERLLEVIQADPVWATLTRLEAARATEADVRLVHAEAYWRRLQTAAEAGGAQLDPDTYMTSASLDVALQGLCGLLAVTRAVLEREAAHGFAAIRPPGHHACPDRAMGFCLLSNVAIAARWAQRHTDVRRIAIVDFDVHHGNGTQKVFYDDPDVLYLSIHQHPLYPGTGMARETGVGRGQGATANVPLPSGTGDAGYRHAFQQLFTPLVDRFGPELVLLSAGYDAHGLDPLGGMRLTTNGFGELVREVLGWADVHSRVGVVAVLEGGYHADALAQSVLATLQVMNDPDVRMDDPLGPSPLPERDVEDHLRALRAHFGI